MHVRGGNPVVYRTLTQISSNKKMALSLPSYTAEEYDKYLQGIREEEVYFFEKVY